MIARKDRYVKRRVMAVKCRNCGDIIYSRARHDFRTCECGDCFVDGGFEYFKYGWSGRKPIRKRINLPVERNVLYDDWNTGTNKYGIIKEIKK